MLADAGPMKLQSWLVLRSPTNCRSRSMTRSSVILNGSCIHHLRVRWRTKIPQHPYKGSQSAYATNFDTFKAPPVLLCKRFHQISKGFWPMKSEHLKKKTRRMVIAWQGSREQTGPWHEMSFMMEKMTST